VILPLRRAHRSAFVALAILLPALLASAWKARRGPLRIELPEDLLPAPPTPVSPHYAFGGEELVYWIPDADLEDRTKLPPDAELIGTVRSGALGRTPPSGKRAVTYSLPHRLVSPTTKDLPMAPGRQRKAP
jgi:hypothetical protein